MEVVCISKGKFHHHDKLEIGKTYVGYRGDHGWGIGEIDESGIQKYVGHYHIDQFITKEEYRELQLNKII